MEAARNSRVSCENREEMQQGWGVDLQRSRPVNLAGDRSQLKQYPHKITGGTGKYQGASGGGTYIYENLTDTLSGGTFKGAIQLQ